MSSRLREVFAYWLLTILVSFSPYAFGQENTRPVAIDGLLDLSEWSFDKQGNIELDGEWHFYFGQHLTSEDIRLLPPNSETVMTVPSYWNESTEFPALGFATYRLEILVADLQPLALKFRTIGTAYRLYVDGELSLEVGAAGQSAATTTPEYRAKLVSFMPSSRRIELVLHVSNFHHRNAGLWEEVRIGTQTDLSRLRESRLSLDLVLYGAILMMALFNLITWFTRRKNNSGLYLGMFCVLISARILLVDERQLNEWVPGIGWMVLTRFELFSWMISMPIFLNFVRSVFPTEMSVLIMRGFWVVSATFAGLALMLPVNLATELVPPYQVVTVIGMIYGGYCIGLALWRGKEGAYLLMAGVAFLYAAGINDILTIIFALDLNNRMQIGLFMFVLLQSIQVSFKSSRDFETVEAQTSELKKSNLELHIQEKLRRAAAGESQILHRQASHEQRAGSYSVVADVVGEQLAEHPENNYVGAQTLRDLAVILRGDDPVQAQLNLKDTFTEFFSSEAFGDIKAGYPLVGFSSQFDEFEGRFFGLPVQIDSLLLYLMRYCFASQIHAQQLTVTSRMDYVFAGGVFHHQIKDGHYYILCIEDQGQGIRPEDLVEVFDPEHLHSGFKHLKASLRDLAVAWTILNDHGGALDLHSLTDSTRLELYFPAGQIDS